MNFNSIDWNFITTRLSQHASSEIARNYLANLSPYSTIEQAQESQTHIQFAQGMLNKGVRPQMGSLDLFESWFQRLVKGAVLKTLELRDVKNFCNEILYLGSSLENNVSPWSKKIRASLMDAEPALSAIDHLISPDGEIRTDASEVLFTLFAEKKQKALQISNMLDQLVKMHQMEPLLQDRYVTNREGRWVLPIKSGMQHSFDGIIHATSQTKQTVFMEPNEIVPLNNRLREIDDLIETEVNRLLRQLSDYLANFKNQWQESKQALVDADICLSKAQLSIELEAHVCRFSQDKISLHNLRHPVLVLKKEKVIANSVSLKKDQRILLLSGPNAGGKTVLLKSIGLAAHMARCGLPICASSDAEVPFFKNFHVIVGDAQNVDLHLSTFAAHLNALKDASTAKSFDSLLLIDEICGSTDPEEGSALARSFIETFAVNEVFAVITSHLGPLKLGWDKDSSVLNGSLESNIITGVPTYKFVAGVPGQSLAIQTAKRVGVNSKLIERAIELLSPQSRLHRQTLDEAHLLKERLMQTQKELDKELSQTKSLKNNYQNMVDKFKEERKNWLEKSIKKAEKKIDDLIAQTKAAQAFERHEKLGQLKKDLPEIVSYSEARAKGLPVSVEEFNEKFPAGTNVYIQSLGRSGLIQSSPNASGEVSVLSQSMRLNVHWKHISLPLQQKTALVTSKSFTPSYLMDSEPILDLRGKRVDEAIQELEVSLDEAILKQTPRLKIIHGHGTEALKRAIRTHLSRSPQIKAWKAGVTEGGGDGVTWVEFL
ncbi:MAG: DNA mismatch repair protein [Proteobacteria bacterium SG_bin7]|nr:MAG: DNA mismatch repair protein [Proteobacteria bacterium SG_bin7]